MKKKEAAEEKGAAAAQAQELEILKAVALAWHGRSGNSRPMKEFDAQRNSSSTCKPSRFKLEAMNKRNQNQQQQVASAATWDFAQSLWDSYEIVTLSKRLESGLAMDQFPPELGGPQGRVRRKRREGKNSLRNLFNRTSSKRYDADHIIPRDDGPHTTDKS